MTAARRVLVTGHRGYIGSVMVPHLVESGYEVVGFDTGYFDECTLVNDGTAVRTLKKDLRDVAPADLQGFGAVVHLGALSNDPIGNLDETWTREINCEASVRLAEVAREAGVRRFLFSSSCIMYGMSSAEVVDEDAPLDPKTEYARSKVDAEHALGQLADDGFSPTFLRNGTVYGLSPRMRFDTVLNDFCGAATTSGRVTVHGDGSPWRPVVHVADVSRAFRTVLEAPLELVHNEAFNTGAEAVNHQVRELAEIAASAVDGELEVLGSPSADQRTYRADFTKFMRTFPDFTWRSAEQGARELVEGLRAAALTHQQYAGARFVRLRWLTHLLESGRLDESLRWAPTAVVR